MSAPGGVELAHRDRQRRPPWHDQSQVLERELAERAGADEEHPRALGQPWLRTPHGAVRRDAGVRQRGGTDRIQRSQRDQVAWIGDEHGLGIAAVLLEARSA